MNAMAQRADTAMTASMAMVPGMPMTTGPGKQAPGKQAPVERMPCGGMDCGCCIGGACAAVFTSYVGLDVPGSSALAKTFYDGGIPAGIAFPPDIRPPIPNAVT